MKPIFLSNNFIIFLAGLLCGLSLAPFFLLPTVLLISILSFNIYNTKTLREVFVKSWIWGYGYYTAALYWVPNALFSSLNQNLIWLIPIAFIFIPLILSITIATQSTLAKLLHQKLKNNFTIIFSCTWIANELVISYIFTGFPWALIGYSVSFSEVLSQTASLCSVYGISLIIIYITSGFYLLWLNDFISLKKHIYTSIILILGVIIYGQITLSSNPTELTNLKVRIVQPSIAIQTKFNQENFWRDLDLHIALSNKDIEFKPDLIIWPESALILDYKYTRILNYITKSLYNFNGLLMTGGADQVARKHYNAFYAIDMNHKLSFMYHKHHLVPFGEYMPFKNILSFTKITHGIEDYTPGTTSTIFHLNELDLTITPLICYESVFPGEVRLRALGSDCIINATFDTWFGNSSGPYQHFYMSKIRAIENGVPVLRAANNGISAIIDANGRTLKSSKIDEVIKIDGFIPKKLSHQTPYSKYGNFTIIGLLLILITQRLFFRIFI